MTKALFFDIDGTLYDQGLVPTSEPYRKRTSHGMILGEDGQKMSKSRGNVVNPDEVVATYGADTMRLYEMFIGDFEKAAPWSSTSIKGCFRFLDRVWRLQEILVDGDGLSPELEKSFHRTIKKVTEDTEQLKFNTAIAAMMALMNEIEAKKQITRGELNVFLRLLSPFAPHITEELWELAGFGGLCVNASWPKYDEAKCRDDAIEIAVQIAGKVRGRVTIPADCSKEDAIAEAKKTVAAQLEGKTIVKEIYVPGKLVNIVAK